MRKTNRILSICALFAICAIKWTWGTDDADARTGEEEWWRTATFYQVYPRSFKDSDGDGVGDLPGITSKLDYLREIGVNAIWLSPCFQSPMVDNGYDVSDFTAIHDEFGTMADYEAMVGRADALGIRIMLDFVPNHSSDKHAWFVQSVARVEPYTDFYTWRDPVYDATGNRQPPNNWVSVFGGRAWTWNERRQQYYLHQFYPEQPDLNYRNKLVLAEMDKVLEFWLERGAAGFRLDAINHMFEQVDLLDEPVNEWAQPDTYDYLDHIYTKDQPETYDVVYHFRELVDRFSAEHKLGPKIIMTEAYASREDTMRYYQSDDGSVQGISMPFNFEFLNSLNQQSNALTLKELVDNWMDYMPIDKTANWVIGSHDHSRVATRLTKDRVRSMATLTQLLPGVSITYYGEEIGMIDNKNFTWKDNRDPYRTPMQWDSTTSAGFSTNATTWLPVHPDFTALNVALQEQEAFSDLAYFKQLTSLRQDNVFKRGEFLHKTYNRNVYTFLRFMLDDPNSRKYAVFINYWGEPETVSLAKAYPTIATRWEQVLSSHDPSQNGQVIYASSELRLNPYEAIIFRTSAGLRLTAPFIIVTTLLVHFFA